VGDGLGHLVFRFRDPDQRGLVAVPGQVAVDAVEACVQLSADEPLPEGRVAGVERRVPVLVPGQQVCVFLEALGKVLFRETVPDRRVVGVGLADEFRRRVVVLLLAPVHRDLRFGYLDFGRVLHVRHLYEATWVRPVTTARATLPMTPRSTRAFGPGQKTPGYSP